jgi:hypothetical protein
MAYLYLRKSGRVEIREAVATPRGPRSRTLASFRGALGEAALERAEAAATRTVDREALRRRAAELGVPITPTTADAEARALIARLRSSAPLDPVLAGLLGELLADCEAAPLPDELSDVAEWIGAGEHERGRALRDVLRLYDRIARSPDAAPAREAERFPRFSVRPASRAS